MSLVNTDTKLCDIVINDPSIVTVLNRFDIALGVGDKTVAKICQEKNLDKDFFTTILNTYINEEYFPEKILSSFSAKKIIDYLNKTNSYYEQFQIPNIESHFHLLISKSDTQNSNLELLRAFFFEVKHELLMRIADDRTRWFPEVIAQEKNSELTSDTPVCEFNEGPDSIEDKINDLINMFVIHLTGDYDLNLGHAVLFAIFSLKKDIKQNNRIRNRILRPISIALSKNK
jgi:iron-sulfur cluster repair protein YtfE (RIC family)